MPPKEPRIDLGLEGLTNNGGNATAADTLDHVTPADINNDGPQRTSDPVTVSEDRIEISDTKIPIILLFGPPASGKSMTLVRLARYLRSEGYTIIADTNFRGDQEYRDRCEQFTEKLDTETALRGNALNEFLLVRVVKNGRAICQILEAPGEHYFDPNKPQTKANAVAFRPYLRRIISSIPVRKIWVFITEANWAVDHRVKQAYVERIKHCKQQLFKAGDKAVILYNKIDKKAELFTGDENINLSAAEKEMQNEYAGIEAIFRNTNPITQLWRPANYKFVPFCTGYYDTEDAVYSESPRKNPQRLWQALEKCIKG